MNKMFFVIRKTTRNYNTVSEKSFKNLIKIGNLLRYTLNYL